MAKIKYVRKYKYVRGSTKNKIHGRGRRKKMMGWVRKIFPYVPPQDLKWNSPYTQTDLSTSVLDLVIHCPIVCLSGCMNGIMFSFRILMTHEFY